MSDSESSGASTASPTPKTETKSETKTQTKSDAKPAAEKSARDSVGGKPEVHYGFFSNVKSPAYRDGWDSIWGKSARKSGSGTRKAGNGKASSPSVSKTRAAPRKKPAAVTLEIDFDSLPEDLRAGLAEVARGRLRKSRVSYDRRAAAGAVAWRIGCTIGR